jgi:hypothetical protein
MVSSLPPKVEVMAPKSMQAAIEQKQPKPESARRIKPAHAILLPPAPTRLKPLSETAFMAERATEVIKHVTHTMPPEVIAMTISRPSPESFTAPLAPLPEAGQTPIHKQLNILDVPKEQRAVTPEPELPTNSYDMFEPKLPAEPVTLERLLFEPLDIANEVLDEHIDETPSSEDTDIEIENPFETLLAEAGFMQEFTEDSPQEVTPLEDDFAQEYVDDIQTLAAQIEETVTEDGVVAILETPEAFAQSPIIVKQIVAFHELIQGAAEPTPDLAPTTTKDPIELTASQVDTLEPLPAICIQVTEKIAAAEPEVAELAKEIMEEIVEVIRVVAEMREAHDENANELEERLMVLCTQLFERLHIIYSPEDIMDFAFAILKTQQLDEGMHEIKNDDQDGSNVRQLFVHPLSRVLGLLTLYLSEAEAA